MTDIEYWIWFSSLVKINTRKRFELIKHYKDPAYIWHSSEEELRKLAIIDNTDIGHIIDKQSRSETQKYYNGLIAADVSIITINSNLYPGELKNIYDPPSVLYVKGSLAGYEPGVAVVGSRRATLYGLETAEKLSLGLSINGVTIISGMARGIDSKAHNGALAADGKTIAVLGCGLDIVYPSENRELMKRICKNGAVISEYLPGTPPTAFNFPVRNRIISGISLGVVVVEANDKSGSLITANYALEQGKEVFAVPGNIDSGNSTGTNKLNRDGAKIVLELGDILDELKISPSVNNNFCKNSI
ncbi:MAG: DNA-protecting protein DprA, partial [Ruminiclostridium sp.]|nr:DNA-protecting protein DprA [Ruminiclostridium sp.]